MDRRLLDALITKYDGGPVGLNTLAVVVGEEAGTLEDVYEPFLIQEGFIKRTARGREATPLAYEHLALPLPRVRRRRSERGAREPPDSPSCRGGREAAARTAAAQLHGAHATRLDYDAARRADRAASRRAARGRAAAGGGARDRRALTTRRFASLGRWLQRRRRAGAQRDARAPGAARCSARHDRRHGSSCCSCGPAPAPTVTGRGACWRGPRSACAPASGSRPPDGALALEVTGDGRGGRARGARGRAAISMRTLREQGAMPLPPYIHRAAEPEDRERYQTVFARVGGRGGCAHRRAPLLQAAARSTRGRRRGIAASGSCSTSGPGRFARSARRDPAAHRDGRGVVRGAGEAAAALMRAARAAGGRIVAVGHHGGAGARNRRATRTAARCGRASGWTRKYHPAALHVPARWTRCSPTSTCRAPRCCCWWRRSRARRRCARLRARGGERYRFYSYGDAMLIL